MVRRSREFSNNELPFPRIVPTYRHSCVPTYRHITPFNAIGHVSPPAIHSTFHRVAESVRGKRPTRILQSSSSSNDSFIDQNPVRRHPQIASSAEGSTASSQENDAQPKESGNSHENTARSFGTIHSTFHRVAESVRGKRPTRILHSSSSSDDSSIDKNSVRRHPKITSSAEGFTASSQENDAQPNENGNSHENTA